MPDRDAHGMTVTKHERFLWVLDRHANLAEIFDVATGAHVGTLPLAGTVSADPSPDLADLAPAGNRIFLSLRGPTPLTGDPHVSTGTTPGLGIVHVQADGRWGALETIVPISNVDGTGVERADPHAIRVRRR